VEDKEVNSGHGLFFGEDPWLTHFSYREALPFGAEASHLAVKINHQHHFHTSIVITR
jgi:hypothetical protein